jgi:hypothetical protein
MKIKRLNHEEHEEHEGRAAKKSIVRLLSPFHVFCFDASLREALLRVLRVFRGSLFCSGSGVPVSEVTA